MLFFVYFLSPRTAHRINTCRLALNRWKSKHRKKHKQALHLLSLPFITRQSLFFLFQAFLLSSTPLLVKCSRHVQQPRPPHLTHERKHAQ
jgi:hypothetical protein